MKRSLVFLAGMAALGMTGILGHPSAAQAPTGQAQPHSQAQAQAPRPLQTRIGLMNMVHVLKNYKKFQAIEENIKKRSQELEKTLEPFRTELLSLRSRYNDPKTPQEEREKIEYRMRQLQLEASQKEEEAKKELIKMNGDAAKTIYREVEEVVSAFARANSLELVLFYNDAVTADDYYHPANIQRKLTQPAAVMPMFVTPGMDISHHIVKNLNDRYTAGMQPPATAPRP